MPDFPPPFDHRNALEDALVAASDDPAARGPFLRLLLDSTVFVIGQAPEGSDASEGEEGTTIQPGISLALASYTMRDGRTAIPFYSSTEWMSGCLREPARYLGLPARALLETTRGETLMLNWGAPWGKEFPPEEIASILDHGTTGERITLAEPRQVTLGLPSVEPTALLATLTMVLAHHPEVSVGYMGWMDDPAGGLPPHAIIGIDGEGDLETALQDAGAAATGPEWGSAPVDFFRITPGDRAVSDFFIREGKRFYTRGAA